MAEATAAEHPTLGGKSIESIQAQQSALATSRRPYKSWRKKYRKMRVRFDAILEENRRLFKEEQKLEGLARRLTEELDSMLEILLDLNENSAIAPELRFNVSYSHTQKIHEETRELLALQLSPNLRPAQANEMMQIFIHRIQRGEVNPAEKDLMRQELQTLLAQHDVRALAMLESKIQPSADEIADFTRDNNPQSHPAFLSSEQEDVYLKRIDVVESSLGRVNEVVQVVHQADLPAKELERQLEIMNPQSQHNWLRTHSKSNTILDAEEVESAQELTSTAKSASRKRNSSKNLVRQIGDRAVDKVMREAYSPSSGIGDEDELAYDEVTVKRRGTSDKDPSFRSKGGKGGSTKTKRKRGTDDGSGGGGGKRVRASEIFD